MGGLDVLLDYDSKSVENQVKRDHGKMLKAIEYDKKAVKLITGAALCERESVIVRCEDPEEISAMDMERFTDLAWSEVFLTNFIKNMKKVELMDLPQKCKQMITVWKLFKMKTYHLRAIEFSDLVEAAQSEVFDEMGEEIDSVLAMLTIQGKFVFPTERFGYDRLGKFFRRYPPIAAHFCRAVGSVIAKNLVMRDGSSAQIRKASDLRLYANQTIKKLIDQFNQRQPDITEMLVLAFYQVYGYKAGEPEKFGQDLDLDEDWHTLEWKYDTYVFDYIELTR